MSAASAWPTPDNTLRTQFANGIAVLARENRSAPVVVLDAILSAGAVDDPADRIGLSSLTANMLSRGSEFFDYDRFNEVIESVGASLSFASDVDSLSIGITCLSEDFPLLVEVMADALRRPTFAQNQFDLVRRRKIVRLQEAAQDTAAVSSQRFYETIYAGHAVGRPVSGYTESVSAATCEDVKRFHTHHYGPAGAVFAVSGDVQPQAAADLLARHLGDWSAAPEQRRLLPIPAFSGPLDIHAPIAEKVQADLVMGVQGVARSHPDYYAIRVANTILGVFGMMGRLGEVVREEQGLAYYAYSSQDSGRESGVWLAAAGVGPANLRQAQASMAHELTRLASEPVDAEELADTQAYLTGVLPLALETNDGIASTLSNIEWYGLGLDFLQRYRGMIESVGVDDVLRVAHTYLRPEAIAVVSAGSL